MRGIDAIYVHTAGLLRALHFPCSSPTPIRASRASTSQHYVFRVTLSDDSDEIAGETTVDVRFVKDGVAEFRLDLASPADGKGMTVAEVASAGDAPVHYTHRADRLTHHASARRPRPAKCASSPSSTHGIPADGLNIGKNKFGERSFFSVNWPDLAHQWLPTIDHPYDKATSEFLVTAPAKYQVVANGLLVEDIDLADGRRSPTGSNPCRSPPGWTISAWRSSRSHHFGTAAGVPLETWVFHQDREAGIATFEEPTRQSIEFYQRPHRPLPLRETGRRGGRRLGRRHGARQRHLLRRSDRQRPPGASAWWRTRPPTSGSAIRSPKTIGTTCG